MSLRVEFWNGSVVEYPGASGASLSPDGSLRFINGPSGEVIATLPAASVKGTAQIPG